MTAVCQECLSLSQPGETKADVGGALQRSGGSITQLLFVKASLERCLEINKTGRTVKAGLNTSSSM